MTKEYDEPLRIVSPGAPEAELATPRLLLRRFVAGDAPLLTGLDADPEVMRFIDGGVAPDAARDRETVARFCRNYIEHPGFGFFAAHRRDDGAFIGWFHFRPDRECAGDTDLGYRLLRADWGRGYATEGAYALMQRGFDRQAVTRVVARAMLANRSSWRVMEKLGMRRVAEFEQARFPGADRRAVKYAIGREEFAGRPAPPAP